MSNEIANRPIMQSGLTKINDAYMPQIESQLQGNGLDMTDYQKQCVLSSIQAINTVLTNKGLSINDVDQSNMTDILLTVAALQLNSSAVPREVYFQTRNVKRKGTDPSNGKPKDIWIKQIEMGIEGDGNDAILSRFGRNVVQVHRFWEVRSEDHFVYPGYKGIEMTPPEWQPTGQGEVIRIVYPITMSDNKTEYYIAEREGVVKNLIAHISNNLMNETFGIAESKFKANTKQKQEIDDKKNEILNELKEMVLDEILSTERFLQYISPAWKSPQSRESMIIRKMRNNIVKKIPKNFENAYVAIKYQEQADEVIQSVRKDVTEHSNEEVFDFDIPHQTESEKQVPVQDNSEVDHEEVLVSEELNEVEINNDGKQEAEIIIDDSEGQQSLFEERTTQPKKRGF